jgi:hypothetical protein
MISKVLLGLLWLGFISYAFVLAPPDSPDTFTLIQHLSTGQWDGINPWVIALFNVMGVWPLLYFGVLFADGDGQKVQWQSAHFQFCPTLSSEPLTLIGLAKKRRDYGFLTRAGLGRSPFSALPSAYGLALPRETGQIL